MRFEGIAKRGRSRGRAFGADVELADFEAGTWGVRVSIKGDNADLQQEKYADRVYEPGIRYGHLSEETEYLGTMHFDAVEIRWLFRELVKGSETSEDFKSICLAMVDLLAPKPKQKGRRGKPAASDRA